MMTCEICLEEGTEDDMRVGRNDLIADDTVTVHIACE